eukprot:286799-Chlamydomonas_euryale.AAC.1
MRTREGSKRKEEGVRGSELQLYTCPRARTGGMGRARRREEGARREDRAWARTCVREGRREG